VTDVLDTEVHSFLDVAVADDLVDNNTDSSRGDVVYNTSAATEKESSNILRDSSRWYAPVVVLVRHTLLLSSIGFDVNDVSNMVVNQEG
jgi:hypothetical protein